LGVGVNKTALDNHLELLDNAVFVSGRDTESCEALQKIRKDAVLMHDPILCIKDVVSLYEFDLPYVNFTQKIDVLWILKYPSSNNDIEMLNMIKKRITEDSDRLHQLVAIEPKLDKVLDEYFHGQEIIYLESLSELSAYINQSEVVGSMRYHGVIFSLLLKRTVYGFSQRKIKALFLDLGLSGGYLEDIADLDKLFNYTNKPNKINATKLTSFENQFNEVLLNFKLPAFGCL
jgi:polysaccharide pyruvyl transferase WcaK-like protein